jgi:hypothetical protein
MDSLEKLEESMKILDVLSVFINKESDYYIESDEIRILIEEVFVKIRDIYESLTDDDCII